MSFFLWAALDWNIWNLIFGRCRLSYSKGAQLLADLSFLPLEGFRLQRCTEAVPSLHRALLQRLPSLLLVAAQLLANAGQVRNLISQDWSPSFLWKKRDPAYVTWHWKAPPSVMPEREPSYYHSCECKWPHDVLQKGNFEGLLLWLKHHALYAYSPFLKKDLLEGYRRICLGISRVCVSCLHSCRWHSFGFLWRLLGICLKESAKELSGKSTTSIPKLLSRWLHTSHIGNGL